MYWMAMALLLVVMILFIRSLSKQAENLFLLRLDDGEVMEAPPIMFAGTVLETDRRLNGLKWSLIQKFVIGSLLVFFIAISKINWLRTLLAGVALIFLLMAIFVYRKKREYVTMLSEGNSDVRSFVDAVSKAHRVMLLFQIICFLCAEAVFLFA